MSKKQARRILSTTKQGVTVKEFLYMCEDMGVWFDDIQGTIMEQVYYTLMEDK